MPWSGVGLLSFKWKVLSADLEGARTMPMRQDCLHFESRSYANGDTVRKCDLDLAPEAPWRCPENCSSFTKRRVDVNWSYGSLVTPETPAEPKGVGSDESIAALLDAAEEIVNSAGKEVLADLESKRSKKSLFKGRKIRKSKKKGRSKD